ncbi:MAG: hypothetical protein MHM6MM_001391 [Cercozoa sp. M6MM]
MMLLQSDEPFDHRFSGSVHLTTMQGLPWLAQYTLNLPSFPSVRLHYTVEYSEYTETDPAEDSDAVSGMMQQHYFPVASEASERCIWMPEGWPEVASSPMPR